MKNRVHISLEVKNLEDAISFYARLFQREPTKVRSDYANFRMESPALHLALVHNPRRTAEPTGNRHYGIELFANDRLNAWLKEVQGAGLEARVEEETTCCYAVANKFWARDPDGHEWEFWVRHGEADAMHGESAEACGNEDSTCCTLEATASEVSVKKKACCAPGQC